MPTCYIDGVPFTYEGRPKVLSFCLERGIEIPFFCYHPSMSIPANCRMCLVEVGMPAKDPQTGEYVRQEDGSLKIQWAPKPVPSCATDITPDLHIRTHRTSPMVQKTQEGVLEFLLINHPLDCPICDQAGECPLQLWTYKYGPEGSRFEEAKVHKPKRIPLGPRVILDAERCINCTRCVRFTDEISKSAQLTIIHRGNKNYPSTAPGQVFDDPYSLCTVDICPVGALTSADHRFKARTWEMNSAPTICTGCARGCNVDIWIRDNRVMRFTPRKNLAINQYWMCDEGRLNYAWLNENRVSGPVAQGETVLSFSEAYRFIAENLPAHKPLFVGSAYSSWETLYVLKVFRDTFFPQAGLYFVRHEVPGWGDNFLRVDDRTPNSKGAEALGYEAVALPVLLKKLNEVSCLYLVEDLPLWEEIAPQLPDSMEVFAHLWNWPKEAHRIRVLLPAATYVEAWGTYTNSQGISQTLMPAKPIRQTPAEMLYLFPKTRLDAAGLPVDRWRSPENIIDALPSWEMLLSISEKMGKKLPFPLAHKALWESLKSQYPELLGSAEYPSLRRKELFKRVQYDFVGKV
ncbi:MAG: (2Fe-2S)-binding protein [Bacteroidia bacterium]